MKKNKIKQLIKKYTIPIIVSGAVLASAGGIAVAMSAHITSNDNYICYGTNALGTPVKTAFIYADGQPAYCLNPRRENPTDTTYQEQGHDESAVASVLANGYPYHSWSSNNEVNYYITQLAVWAANGDASVDGVGTWVDSKNGIHANSPSDQYIIDDAAALVRQAIDHPNAYLANSITTSAPNVSFTRNGDYYYSQPITINGQGTINPGCLYNVSLSGQPNGTEICDPQHGMATGPTFSLGQKFIIRVPVSAVSGPVNIKYTVTTSGATVRYPGYFKSSNPQIAQVYQSLAHMYNKPVTDQVSGQGSISPQKATLKVVKLNTQTGQLVNGCTFGLYQNGNLIQQQVTGNDGFGVAKFINITPGNYQIKELKAPQGFILSNKVLNVDVKAGVSRIDGLKFADNEKTTNMVITKQSANTGKPLAGAKFGLFENGKEINSGTSNAQGKVDFNNLDFGNYQVKELSAPAGYNLSSEVWNDTINQSDAGNTQAHTFKDTEKQTALDVFKVDNQTGAKLQGAKFGLFKDGKEIQTKVTGSNGEAQFTGLEAGAYQVKELQAPQGYTCATGTWDINLSVDQLGQTFSYTFKDNEIPTTLNIVKVDKNTGAPLGGATFGLYQNDKLLKQVTTDSKGNADFAGVDFGTYQVKEISAPAGYEMDSSVWNVNLNPGDAGKTIGYKFYDAEKQTNLDITKLDAETGKPIANTTFGLFDNGKQISTGKTNAQGKLEFNNLAFGNYQVKELQPAQGYESNTNVWSENINAGNTGKTLSYTFKDNEVPTTLNILKVDKNTGAPLAGATFGLYQNNKLLKQVTTNDKGQADFAGVDFGTYQVKEITAPTGYDMDSSVWNVNLNQGDAGKTIGYKFFDAEKLTNLDLTKVDATTGKPIEGTTFGLFDNGKQVATGKTNAQGKLDFNNLPFGEYQVKELKPATGYQSNSNVWTEDITASSAGQTYNYTFKDSPITSKVEISKIDFTTSKPVAGAKIEITGLTGDDTGKTIEWTSTLKPHELTLPYGTYKYEEKDAPKGYEINTTVGNIDVTTQGAVIKAVVKDKEIPTNLNVIKVNAKNGDKLEGAEFGLYKDGKEIQTAKTDKDGALQFKDLLFGNYQVKELKAPVGFNLSKQVWNEDITPDNAGTKLTYTFKDTEITGIAKISKVDITNNKPVIGARIKITCTSGFAEGKTWTWVSTLKPHDITLPYGKYEYQEIEAPEGYLINKTVTHFEITKQGEIIKGVVKDTPITGTVIIHKIDSNSGQGLSGATFGVWNAQHQLVDKLTTNKEGYAKVTLRYGDYTVKEIKAPEGYNLNPNTFKADITHLGDISITVKDSRLPKTGGIFTPKNLGFIGLLGLGAGALLLFWDRARKGFKK